MFTDRTNYSILALVFSICLCSQYASAENGLLLQASLGLPTLTIQNPDSSNSVYSGTSLFASTGTPIISGSMFSSNLYLGYRYSDLQNNYKSNYEEIAKHMGPAVGLQFGFGKLDILVDYSMIHANHYLVGPISNKSEFDYSSLTTSLGLSVPVSNIDVGLRYSYSSGLIEKSETGLSADSKFNEQVISLTFTYQLKTGVSDIVKGLGKR